MYYYFSNNVSFNAAYLNAHMHHTHTMHTHTHTHTHACTHVRTHVQFQYLNAQIHIVNNTTHSGCGVMCHKKCEKKMPNLCGISQKLLAEAVKGVNEEKKRRKSVSCSFVLL